MSYLDLKELSTQTLVNELATREGVLHLWVSSPESIYSVTIDRKKAKPWRFSMTVPYNPLREFYKQREGPRVVIPQYERPDGQFPPAWLARRMSTQIDRRVR